MARRFGNIPTPLEVVDGALDTVLEVAQLPGRLTGNLAGAVAQTAQGFNQGLRRPEDYSDIPAPPDVVAGGALDSVGAVVSGVLDGLGGIVRAVTDTGNGVRRQIDTTFGR